MTIQVQELKPVIGLAVSGDNAMPYNEFKAPLVLESKGRSSWYHTTTKDNLKKIQKEGLKIDSAPNFSMASLKYMNNIYGMVPIFLAKTSKPYIQNDPNAIVLEVDTSGLELVADVPTLASHFGAYIEEDHIWFEQDNKRAPRWGRQEESIPYEDLIHGDFREIAIKTTGTCAVMQNISVDRIKVLIEETQEYEDEYEVQKLISLKDLVVNYESLFDAYTDCRYRKACSKSEGPIQVFEIEDEEGKYQLFDGYHRLFEYLIDLRHRKNMGMIPVEINNSYMVKQNWAVAPKSKRWLYDPSKKYGNLEVFFHKRGERELDTFVKSR